MQNDQSSWNDPQTFYDDLMSPFLNSSYDLFPTHSDTSPLDSPSLLPLISPSMTPSLLPLGNMHIHEFLPPLASPTLHGNTSHSLATAHSNHPVLFSQPEGFHQMDRQFMTPSSSFLEPSVTHASYSSSSLVSLPTDFNTPSTNSHTMSVSSKKTSNFTPYTVNKNNQRILRRKQQSPRNLNHSLKQSKQPSQSLKQNVKNGTLSSAFVSASSLPDDSVQTQLLKNKNGLASPEITPVMGPVTPFQLLHLQTIQDETFCEKQNQESLSSHTMSGNIEESSILEDEQDSQDEA
jgi:hypothetical protein